MAGFQITKKEFKTRLGYILLGFFSVYLVDPIEQLVNANLSINPLVFGFAGIALTLWFFEF